MNQASKEIPIHELPDNRQFAVYSLNFFNEKHAEYPPHRHKHYEIIWFKKAEGEHYIDFMRYGLSANTLWFLSPNQVHQTNVDSCDGHLVTFTESFFDKDESTNELLLNSGLFFNIAKQPVIQLDPEKHAHIDKLFDLMMHEYKSSGTPSILRNYLKNFLLYCGREYDHTSLNNLSRQTGDERILQLRKIIEEHFIKNKEAGFYASMLGITPKRLNELVKKHTGRTISSLIHDRVITESKRLLSFSPQSVKEISYALGFDDPAYFNRFFKKQTGKTPVEYRQQHAG
ncbi:MAG: DNA-binding domain-containing protein [Bacteroidetes bacterium]|nr:MAG: DNA-binding domain-containing protein [Bacteroidota bacterium]